MKISQVDHDYLNLKKDPIEKYLSVFQYKFCAECCHVYVYHEIYFYVFYIPKQKRKTSKPGILEILPSWYILSLKPKGKGDCKHLIHLSSVSCLIIFLI